MKKFQSTHSLRSATLSHAARLVRMTQFQSTHSLRSATVEALTCGELGTVSIHALLAECDHNPRSYVRTESRFNPRTPCGVRPCIMRRRVIMICFNPRTPCGVRLHRTRLINKHKSFQSTHSLRSATMGYTAKWAFGLVSIHALLAECDMAYHSRDRGRGSFNPRTPCGVRPVPASCLLSYTQFQSTHSLRSATRTGETETIMETVSIHALLAECDQ